jgi:hypothetical protein
LRRVRQVFSRIPSTLAKNHRAFDGPKGRVSGFGAGDLYPQIWLRDSAWIVDAAAAYYEKDTLTSWLDLHLAQADKNGRLNDWVAPGPLAPFLQWAPGAREKSGFSFDTNSNESDQEPSAALALCRTEALLGADPEGEAARAPRFLRVNAAMDALLRDRTDLRTGLVWSGLTADWGDVSPLYPDQRAIYLDRKTPRTLSLYTNVMAYAALDCLAGLAHPGALKNSLAARAAALRDRIRSAFWMKERGYFRIRRTLDPVPEAFDGAEDERFALGGNALAALLGAADDAEAAALFDAAERLREANHFSTVSTTLIPPYPAGTFLHPAMREPFRYQNGGQWDWFGALLVRAEFERGRSEQARAHLDQIASRVLRAGEGLNEWYGQDAVPEGSAAYAASAAALYHAIVRGLLGLSPDRGGYRVTIRAGETLRPFEVAGRATGGTITVSQRVSENAIEVTVDGGRRIHAVCAVLPPGRTAAPDPDETAAARPTVTRQGEDTVMCADASSLSAPRRVRFAIARR